MVAKILGVVMAIHPFVMVSPFSDMHRMPYNMLWNPRAMLATIDLYAKYFV